MHTKILSTVLAAAAVFIAGCDNSQQVEQIRQQADQAIAEARQQAEEAMAQARPLAEDVPQKAVAVLHPTEGNDAAGTVVFTPAGEGGLRVATDVSGLTPGEHGYHIHLYGDCTAADGTSAGTHFNLDGSSLNPPEDIDRITGDLGNLEAGGGGEATHETVIDASLTGPKSIIGRAVIVHEKPNDPGEPPIGAAGSRQACGVIGIAKVK